MYAGSIRRFTAAAAVATVTTLGLAAAGPASAATTPSAAVSAKGLTGPIYTMEAAGYRAGFATGWRFRWITATFPVLSCGDEAAQHGWSGNGAELGANSGKWNAAIGAGCDSGGGADVGYQITSNGTTGPEVPLTSITPAAGHRLTVSIYYDRKAGALRFTATDRTTGDSIARAVSVSRFINYYGAEAGSQFAGTVSAPPTKVKTGAFSECALTSYNVRRGTMLGPWPTSQVKATDDGTPGGNLIANAPVLFNGGASFGVWERASA
jgi:hypothetical protein